MNEEIKRSEMITAYILIGLGGLFVGSLTTLAIKKDFEPETSPVVVVSDPVAGGQQDVIKQVTSPDLVSVSCSKDHIDKHGDLLCREMFCRLQQRGIDAKTSGSECEEISNIANTKIILDSCIQEVKVEGSEETVSVFNEDCTRLFRERK